MSISEIITKMNNDNEFWEFFNKLNTTNEEIDKLGKLQSQLTDMQIESNKYFFNENLAVVYEYPIKKYANGKSIDVCFAISNNSFVYLPNDPKSIADFKQQSSMSYLINRSSISPFISNNKIPTSQYYGICNTIFENEKIGDFLLSHLNDDGKEAYNSLYNIYKKYVFNKEVFLRKTIPTNFGDESPELLAFQRDNKFISIGIFSNSVSIKFSGFIKDNNNKSIPYYDRVSILRDARIMLNKTREGYALDSARKLLMRENFIELYLMFLNYKQINSTIDELLVEYRQNTKEYIDFLEEAKEVFNKYYLISKI